MKQNLSIKKSVLVLGFLVLGSTKVFAGAGAVLREHEAACKVRVIPEARTTNLSLFMNGIGQTDLSLDKREFGKLTSSPSPVRIGGQGSELVIDSEFTEFRPDRLDRRVVIRRKDTMNGTITHTLQYQDVRLVRYEVESEKQGKYFCNLADLQESRFARVKANSTNLKEKQKSSFRPVALIESPSEETTTGQ